MGTTEEILESFFATLSKDNLFKDPFIEELRKLVESGKVDQETLRGLIEEDYSNGTKD